MEEKFEKSNEDILKNLESTETIDVSVKKSELGIVVEDYNPMDLSQNPVNKNATPVPTEKEAPEIVEYDLVGLNDSENKRIILEKKDLEKTFVISSARVLEPVLKDNDGNFIPPKKLSDKADAKIGYKTKLEILYEDSDIVSYIPNIKWYPGVDRQTNRKVLKSWFGTDIKEEDLEDNFIPVISKLYYAFCKFKGIEVGKLGRAEFVKDLVGETVVLKQAKYKKLDGSFGYRVDIKEFVAAPKEAVVETAAPKEETN
jgi:hypothetical protein